MASETNKRQPLAKLREKQQPPTSYIEDLTGGEQSRKLRARRKDATGQKSDYHQGTTALAVRVPDPIAEQVKARAASEGLKVNAWLARLIEQALKN